MAIDVAAEIEALRFNIVRSIRYHDRRRGFFDKMSKFSKAVSLFGSTAAFVTVLKSWSNGWAMGFAATSAFFTIADTIFGSATRYTLHTDLKNRFSKLLVQLEGLESPTAQDLARLTETRREIEESEPSVLHVLNCICYNYAINALALDPADRLSIGPIQAFFAQWIDLWPGAIKPKDAQ